MTDRSRECLKQASRLCTIPRCPGRFDWAYNCRSEITRWAKPVAMPNFD
jgi:hypothetical protein